MMLKKLLSSISWLLFDKFMRILIGVLTMVWVARYLGPADFGSLNYAIAYVTLFSAFTKLGLDQIVVREIVKGPKKTIYILGTAFFLKLLGSIFASFLVVVTVLLTELSWSTRSMIIIISLGFIFQSIDVIDYFFQSKILAKKVAIARTLALLLTCTLKIYFIIFEYTLEYFAIASAIEMTLAFPFLVYIYSKHGQAILNWRFSIKTAKSLLSYSWPLAISIFLITVHTRIDQIMIGNLLNTEQVGIYSISVSLSEFWAFIPSVIVITLTPYFIALRGADNKLYYRRLMNLYSTMFWLGFTFGLLVLIFGNAFIINVFGVEYSDAYTALVFNVWNGIFIAQAHARGIWLISEDLQRYRLYNNIIAVLLNIGLNLILIPIWGISGAAMATLVTQAVCTWGVSLFWKPMRASTLSLLKSINPKYLISYDFK